MAVIPTVPSGGGSGHVNWIKNEFTPTNGQVTFILSQAPTDVSSLLFFINGIQQDDVTDFTVSGVTITWLDLNYTMQTTDKVEIKYQ